MLPSKKFVTKRGEEEMYFGRAGNYEVTGWDFSKNGQAVSHMRESNSLAPITKLGHMALWHCFTKKVVDLKAPTVGIISKFAPDIFKNLLNAPRPEFIKS